MLFKKKEKKQKESTLNWKILKRIWHDHTKKFIWPLVGAMLITSLTALTEAYSVSLLKPIFDNGFIDKDNSVLFVLCGQIIVLYFIKGWFYFAQTLILSKISTKTVQSIQQKVFSHLISLDMAYFNKNSSGQMLARITHDCESIKNIAINFITHIFKDLITCISMFGLMIFYSWKMCLVIFLFFPIGAIAIGIINKRVKSISKSDTQQSANFVNQISESLQNVKIIKSYCMEKFEATRIKDILNSMFNLSMKRVKNTAVVTHGGVIMSLMQTYALPEAPMHEWLTPSCCGYTIRIDPSIWSRGMKVEAVAECPAQPEVFEHELWDVYDPDKDEFDVAYWEDDSNFPDEQ